MPQHRREQETQSGANSCAGSANCCSNASQRRAGLTQPGWLSGGAFFLVLHAAFHSSAFCLEAPLTV